ncbi:MAG: type IV secretion system DNA-binding domain-containing protein [Minisyncoccia bacterium]
MDNPERVTYFATTDSRGKRVPFGIKEKDRSKHMYVIGKTGMGKSTMLENLAIQDIRNGQGIAFIDPHGSSAEKLLDYIPEERVNDVVYFAPFDLDNPIAFNVMEDVGYDKRHLVVSGLMATFKKIWVDAWSARMEYILSNTLLALLEYPGATLLGVNRMYVDKGYRKKVVENVKDPVVKDFWTKEFATYTDRYTQEATPAIQNKIGQFTSNPLIRNIIGQEHSSFDIRDLMDQKKILIMNLSKGLMGETNMRLLGSMLTTRIFLAAMSRADSRRDELERLPNVYFYVDEFQNFANSTFAEILSEARKYKLNLTIAHQYVEQMEEEQVRAAVFGNVGTTIMFRVGPFDAEILETIFTPEFMKEDLVNLGFAQIYLSLMIDGIGSRPFSALTIPPIEPPSRNFRNEVIASSRRQFATTRAFIEEAIFTELSLVHEEPKQEKKPAVHRGAPGGDRNGGGENRNRGGGGASRHSRGEDRRNEHEPQTSRKEEAPRSDATKASDLASAIAALTKRSEAESSIKKEAHQKSIQEAVAAVAPKPPSPVHSPSPPRAVATGVREAENNRQEPRQNPEKQGETRKPYEVPEEQLSALFREDL